MTGDAILIVEDQPVVAAVLSSLVRSRGFRVFVAHDMSGVIEHVGLFGGEIGLVLLDVMLPGKDGYDVARELIRRIPHATIVPTTALEEHEVAPIFQQMGIETFLFKPFSVAELDHVLCSTFGIHVPPVETKGE